MRPIDADAFIKENAEIIDCEIDHPKYQDTLRELIDEAPTIERPHGEWIPCSERLPEKDGRYIVCWCGDWGVDVCIAEYSQSGKYWLHNEGCEIRGITAWMQLPEPYKEGGEAE